jgi:hypothetical protein
MKEEKMATTGRRAERKAGRSRIILPGIICTALALALFAWLFPWDRILKSESGRGQAALAGDGDASQERPRDGEMAEEPGTDGGSLRSDATGDGPGRADAGEVSEAATGEDFSQTSPTQRYVSETQRHQNFLAAVALGRVRRMDFISTDYQPASDPNSSYITFSLLTSDGGRSTGMMVMKQESGMWRISAVKQLAGDLGGGTNYLVPAGFEDVLASELQEHQPFFSKLAQGRVSALIVDDDQHPSDTETVLIGRVVGRSGRTENTIMYLRKDYNLWHLTGFDYR